MFWFCVVLAWGLTLCPVCFWMPTWQSKVPWEGTLNQGISWISLACGHVGGALSYLLMKYEGSAHCKQPFPEQEILSCIRKKLAKHAPKSKPASSVPPQCLPWLLSMMDFDPEMQPNKPFPSLSCFLRMSSQQQKGDEHLGPHSHLRSILSKSFDSPPISWDLRVQKCVIHAISSLRTSIQRHLSIACLNLNAGIKGIITPHQAIMFLNSSCLNT